MTIEPDDAVLAGAEGCDAAEGMTEDWLAKVHAEWVRAVERSLDWRWVRSGD
ncbi:MULTISPECIES: hypothetical protein [unclassified Rhodococcus (in: high G+C Gram-positive bacteria)]|uniref:hypothetical protein n=1 Tax=unclassified Rhodococcus (in: high G+C Gram-positive bacteria) TaxID=192944 RepID=UPI0012EE02E9|nr:MULTISPECIES: hypothetical protein [unclassified Rhodococcus (in: high G+C Gram-positive bacteria)]